MMVGEDFIHIQIHTQIQIHIQIQIQIRIYDREYIWVRAQHLDDGGGGPRLLCSSYPLHCISRCQNCPWLYTYIGLYAYTYRFKCSQCKKTISTVKTLKKHERTTHYTASADAKMSLVITHVHLLAWYMQMNSNVTSSYIFVCMDQDACTIQLLEYVIPTPAAAAATAAVSPKSPRCYGVSLCYGVNLCYGVSHVMVLAMLWC